MFLGTKFKNELCSKTTSYTQESLIVHLCSVAPQKLCVITRVKYYIVRMCSMPYYTYGSTAYFLVLEPTVLIYISKEQCCKKDLRGVGNFKIERVIR